MPVSVIELPAEALAPTLPAPLVSIATPGPDRPDTVIVPPLEACSAAPDPVVVIVVPRESVVFPSGVMLPSDEVKLTAEATPLRVKVPVPTLLTYPAPVPDIRLVSEGVVGKGQGAVMVRGATCGLEGSAQNRDQNGYH